MNLEINQEIACRLCKAKGWGEPFYIDHGASAAVYSVQTDDGAQALKIYDPEFFKGDNAIIEEKRIELQSALRDHECPHLVQVFEAEKIDADATWYLTMEFCDWPSLEKALLQVPPDAIHSLIKQLVLAVQYLNDRHLVHRDIKPANIVVSPNFRHLKLLDFGVMRSITHDEGNGTDGNKFIATAQYSPPEFLTRDEAIGAAGFEAINVYQVGAVLHDMITRTQLFAEEKATGNKFKLFKAVTEKPPRIVSESVAPRLIGLCVASLDKDPKRRAASVKLSDFLSDADDIETLRRRLAGGAGPLLPVIAPAIASWRQHVRAWGSEAAKLEAETLGSVTMPATNVDAGVRWTLHFSATEVPIFLELIKNEKSLGVYVLASVEGERPASLFSIGVDGPSIPETGIPGVLAAQYLYALDTALIIHQAQLAVGGDGRE